MTINIVMICPICISFLRCHLLSGFLLSIFFSISTPVGAWEVGLEQGKSTQLVSGPADYNHSHYSGLYIRISTPVFIECSIAGWEGETYGTFSSLSLGQRTKGIFFAEYALGKARIVETNTIQLNGKYQYLISTGIGYRFENANLVLKYKHLSNGEETNNSGIDFLALGFGVNFK